MFNKIFTNYSTVKLGVIVWKIEIVSPQYKKVQQFENSVLRYAYLKIRKFIMRRKN